VHEGPDGVELLGDFQRVHVGVRDGGSDGRDHQSVRVAPEKLDEHRKNPFVWWSHWVGKQKRYCVSGMVLDVCKLQ